MAVIVGCLAAALAVASCTEGTDNSAPQTNHSRTSGASAVEAAGSTGEEMDLSVLVYNIEYGGNASTDQVIRDLDADVVGVLESYNRLPEIADRTGYPYYNVGLQLLSKYPIHEPSGADGLYALIEVQPGYAIAFFNTHLDYVKYGPRLLKEGVPVADVMASEQEVRGASMDILVPDLEAMSTAGYPTFLTGDFNEPSSLDYTKATIGARKGQDEPVPWPVSESLLGIGLNDTYRETHPDPAADPGSTHRGAGGIGDRIDYVYAGGPVEIQDSQLVGQEGDLYVDIGYPKWTSDHRAVLASFVVTPLALPTTVSLDRRMLTEGDQFTVLYNSPEAAETTVTVLPEGAELTEAVAEQTATDPAGSMAFDTSSMPPGGYVVVMTDQDGNVAARNQLWVRSEDATVQIGTDAPSYQVGEPIEVSWDDGPANRWDWIGLYRAEAANPNKDDYLLWGYTGGHDSGALPPTVDGSMTLGESSQGNPWPLPPGDYVVHYLLADQYRSAGQTGFTVTR